MSNGVWAGQPHLFTSVKPAPGDGFRFRFTFTRSGVPIEPCISRAGAEELFKQLIDLGVGYYCEEWCERMDCPGYLKGLEAAREPSGV